MQSGLIPAKTPISPQTWYQEPLLEGAMVNMGNHPALWNNRQSPRLHEIFTELWGTGKLWVVLDRVNLNPPVNEQWQHEGFLHWDMDPTQTAGTDVSGRALSDGHQRRYGRLSMCAWFASSLAGLAGHAHTEEGMPPPGVTGRDWMMSKGNIRSKNG